MCQRVFARLSSQVVPSDQVKVPSFSLSLPPSQVLAELPASVWMKEFSAEEVTEASSALLLQAQVCLAASQLA